MKKVISNAHADKTAQRLKQLCLLDDNFMTKCFEDNVECTELVLHIILEKRISSYRGENALGRLMHDFSCKEPSDMYYSELAERTGYFKDEEKGGNVMSGVLDEIREEGRLDGQLESRQTIIFRMLDLGKLKLEDIAEYTGLTLEEVKAFARQENK